MQISPRLLKIASLIPKSQTLADVGTDHGYIPAYCLLEKRCEKVIPMDINAKPLERAKKTLESLNLTPFADFRLSDGLSALPKWEADTIVIAGMGGPLICEILEKGKDIVTDDTTLILQPMIAPIETRMYLYNNGFCITDEYVVREEDKFYNIFVVKKEKSDYDDNDIYIGRNLLKNSPEIIQDYLGYKIRVCEKIINGNLKSNTPDNIAIQKYQHELSIYNAFLKELI